MSTHTVKPTYSPVPLRAYRDADLTALDLRVLAAIAAHDRFNANGQGCWASNERLADVGGCHVKSVPRSIRRLLLRGYLRDLGAKPGKQRSRSRFLTVIYNEQDAVAFQAPAAKHPEPAEPQPVEPTAEPVKGGAPEASPGPPSQPLGYLEGNRVVTQREKGRYYAEALGSAQGLMRQPAVPTGPPVALGSVLDRRADAQRQLALQLGNGNLTLGYNRLSALPDARGRPRHG